MKKLVELKVWLLIAAWVVLLGFVAPALVSSESDELVVAGVVAVIALMRLSFSSVYDLAQTFVESMDVKR